MIKIEQKNHRFSIFALLRVTLSFCHIFVSTPQCAQNAFFIKSSQKNPICGGIISNFFINFARVLRALCATGLVIRGVFIGFWVFRKTHRFFFDLFPHFLHRIGFFLNFYFLIGSVFFIFFIHLICFFLNFLLFFILIGFFFMVFFWIGSDRFFEFFEKSIRIRFFFLRK